MKIPNTILFPTHAESAPRATYRNANEQGVVLIWTAISMLMIMGIIGAGLMKTKSLDRVTDVEFSATGHAREVARAGLTDAYAWFRRQEVQPVYSFAPQLDLAADPPVNQTEDPNVGLVRTFEISPGFWGRYEVLKAQDAETWTDTNGDGVFNPLEDTYDDFNSNGRWDAATGTRDVSNARDVLGFGANWILHSRGSVYRIRDEAVPVDQLPNERVASATLETEIRRLAYAPPAQAAVCCTNGSDIVFGNNARIRGGTDAAGVVHYSAAGFGQLSGVPTNSGAEIYGDLTPVPDYRGSVTDIFGVSHDQLRGMSDIATSDPVNGLPDRMPDSAMVYIEGNPYFTVDRPLRGSGILVVKGNLHIQTGSNSFYQGMIFVEGSVYINGPSYFRGQIIATEAVHVYGSAGDFSEVEYDERMSTLIMRKLGQYRFAKAPYKPLPKLRDGRPDERHIGGLRRVTNFSHDD